MSTTSDTLRHRHPEFVYESYSHTSTPHGLDVQFVYRLKPDISFTHTLFLPAKKESHLVLENLIFHLGLVIAISYWKSACSPLFHIAAGNLSDEQLVWWKDLMTNGLGEFYFTNDIDFSSPSFVTLTSDQTKKLSSPAHTSPPHNEIVMVGGGKESVVTLSVLKSLQSPHIAMGLNPTQAAVSITEQAGYEMRFIPTSLFDPLLIKLNKDGYLNGHTPFSALLAFLGTAVAIGNGYKYVIAANERSAEEASVTFHNLPINHQYSKTYKFEKLFREYSQTYLVSDVEYFSFLRPLYELQIGKIFSSFPEQFKLFRSCNIGSAENAWCLNCAKCAFTYITLFPFLKYEDILSIFGRDLYEKSEIYHFFYKLVGLEDSKPFECVGTHAESQLAILLSVKSYLAMGKTAPSELLKLAEKIQSKAPPEEVLIGEILEGWGSNHFIPDPYLRALEKVFKTAS